MSEIRNPCSGRLDAVLIWRVFNLSSAQLTGYLPVIEDQKWHECPDDIRYQEALYIFELIYDVVGLWLRTGTLSQWFHTKNEALNNKSPSDMVLGKDPKDKEILINVIREFIEYNKQI